MARNNVETTYTNQNGKFAKGNPGRPKGSRHKYVLAVQDILDGEAETLGRKVVDLALAGDTAALRLCLERIVPPKKHLSVEFDLPAISDANGMVEAAKAVLQAVSEGKLAPADATVVMTLVERFGRVLELSEYEARIKALERAIKVGST
jgi:hypothetical protein